jgi:SAGA-associated factor 29
MNNSLLTFTVTDPKSKTRLFVQGAEVFYRSRKPNHLRGTTNMGDDGEGILCTITGFKGEGKNRRYEVIDVEPEDGASPYLASANQLVAIPASNAGLPDPTVRKTVLAMYPSTTTFYRAEVTSVKAKDILAGWVRLRFEEEEDERQSVVEKRYVLLDWPGKQQY